MTTKVAITGMGLLVPGYTQPEALFNDLYAGRSLLRSEQLGSSGNSTSVVSSSLSQDELATLDSLLPELNQPNISKASKMAVYTAKKALKQAGLDLGKSPFNTLRTGLFLGINKNVIDSDILALLWKLRQGQSLNQDENELIKHELASLNVSQASELVAKTLKINGPCLSHSDACIGGAAAIISAARRIEAGELDIAICGASENGANPMMQLHFYKLGALCQSTFSTPEQSSRPFDKQRAGCVLADGSAFIVLESEAHAKKRGANCLALIAGSSRQSEAYKPTSTAANGSLYAKCINSALNNAQLKANSIDHINAHGTSTVSNDKAESSALDTVFKHKPTVTSTKSALGHSLAASGAIEAVLSVMSLQQQKVLPTLNYNMPKEGEMPLNIVTQGKQQQQQYVLSNSFGFGGENACLIFAKGNNNDQH